MTEISVTTNVQTSHVNQWSSEQKQVALPGSHSHKLRILTEGRLAFVVTPALGRGWQRSLSVKLRDEHMLV